jgi:DNA-binding Xre family transcriptional regulator
MSLSYKPLFRLLLEKDMKKTDLCKPPLGFALGTVAKFSKNEAVALDVLCKLCEYFGCQMNDIVEYVPEGGAPAEGGE